MHREKGSDVDEGGGVCTEKTEVMLMRVVVVCAEHGGAWGGRRGPGA